MERQAGGLMSKIIFVVCLLITWTAYAQEHGEMPVGALFDLAVQASPLEYGELRGRILREVTGPADFQSLIDTQESIVYAALAEAMRQRYLNPDTSSHYDDLLEYTIQAVAGPPGSRGYMSNMAVRLKDVAAKHTRGESRQNRPPYGDGIAVSEKERELSEILSLPEFIPFWVEASLKNPDGLCRYYAAERLAAFDMPVSQQTFLEILKNEKEPYTQGAVVDLITDPTLLSFLFEELKEWNNTERKERLVREYIDDYKKRKGDHSFISEYDTADMRQLMIRTHLIPLHSAIIRAFNRMEYTESTSLLKEIYTSSEGESFKREILEAFAQIKDPNTLPFLSREFEIQPGPDLAETIGSIDIQTYLEYLEGNNSDRRFMCVMGAISLKDKRIILPLARIAMEDGRLDIRRQAIDRIACYKVKDSTEPFGMLLNKEWGPEVRKAAVTALGRSGLQESVSLLKRAVLEDPVPEVRLAAIQAFEDLPFPETAQFLEQYEIQASGQELDTVRRTRNRIQGELQRLEQQEMIRRFEEQKASQ